jgi:hypothetical protein
VLLINGRVLGPTNPIVTTLPRPGDITIENTQTIEARVDGQPPRSVTTDELRALLTERPKRMLNLRLVNGRTQDNSAAAVEFRIRIDVPHPDELDAVDDAFLRHLARENATREDVMRFSDETDGLANHYRDGLVSYVVGVFAKDDTAAVDNANILGRALDNFGRAGHHLGSFSQRPVGAAVAACARLNLNELTVRNATTGVTAVDLVSRFLLELSMSETRPTWPEQPSSRLSELRCPVDEATFALLELVFELSEVKNPGQLDGQLERIEHANLTSPDRAKLALIVGEWAHRRGQTDTTRRCATVLHNDPVFGTAVERWSRR